MSADDSTTIFLERREGEYRRVTVEAADGGVRIFCHDIGRTASRMFGDSDIESWVAVPADQLQRLALALLAERYEGQADAVEQFNGFCRAKGVAATLDRWF